MLGALYGDIVGSRFEFTGFNYYRFFMFSPLCTYTDDSLMTLAVADALIKTKDDRSNYQEVLIKSMKDIAHRYPNVSWGNRFRNWLFYDKESKPYNSFGNGSAMRISPVGWVCNTLEETIELSRLTTEITHNHPEGIKGAEAVVVAIFMSRKCASREHIKQAMVKYYPELETMTIQGLKASGYGLDREGKWETCQGSVPQAICAFLESKNFEDAIRKAISLGGDSDTQACITGSIAEAYYGLTEQDEKTVMNFLPPDLREIYFAFNSIKLKN